MKKIVVICIAISFFNISAYASYEEAVELFQEKKYKESLKIVADELIVAKDLEPDSPNYKLRFLAAHLHWKLGNTDPVLIHFRRCMDIAKDKIEPYVDLALYFIELKKYEDAAKLARRGMKIKDDAMFYYILGKVSLSRSSYWRAKSFFEKANSLNQELYISYHDLGMVLMKLKKYGHANTAFSAAASLNPDSAEVLNNLGLSYEMMGKYREARKYYGEALVLSKDNSVIKQNLDRVKNKK
ncbi:tetratricopeptide repeat protein [Spirochaetota bacterium]